MSAGSVQEQPSTRGATQHPCATTDARSWPWPPFLGSSCPSPLQAAKVFFAGPSGQTALLQACG